ncbi:hypothetical protein [Lysobacter sp. yr284]|uniref:hypothetical protein n=1 Tax=Lysobacter sp. yr284 TaxID=1761791 RepID=UPI0011143EFC|nr:hypothetical protein [Lysobacter sp. yr284]
MAVQTPAPSCLALLLHSLCESHGDSIHVAKLDPDTLDYLQTRASERHFRAISEARDLLDVVLESLEYPAPPEHQRRLIERADDELASAQRWGELAANARFCREHPELAQQLTGDAPPDDGALDRAAATASEPTPRRAKPGARKPG